jgi:uncharacterized membrane-anchored protein YhcB (DUF1043 family)
MKSRTIWISGLMAGVAIGAYCYKNQSRLEPQQKKFKKLVADLQSVIVEIKDQLLASGQEGLEQAKRKMDSIKN